MKVSDKSTRITSIQSVLSQEKSAISQIDRHHFQLIS